MPGPWSSRLRHAVVREEGGYLLELLAVTGFAVTQPVLDVFGRSAETFVAEGATAHDVLGFGLAFAVVPAVLLLAVGLLSRPVGPRARQGVHRATVGVATGAFVVQALMRGSSWPVGVVWALGAATVAVVSLLAWPRRPVSQFLRFAALGPLVFLGMFLLSPVGDLVLGSTARRLGGAASEAPVLFVVLDELPTASLLDGEDRVDSDLFPNLASLAGEATWYRNTTTVAPETAQAVPAILTGRRPRSNSVPPVASSHPENLFTWLGSAYGVHAGEPFTHLCPNTICRRAGVPGGGLRRLLRRGVDVWADRFGRRSETDAPPAFGGLGEITRARVDPVERFLAGYRPRARRRLDYVHMLLPHNPWQLLPSGRRYDESGNGTYFGEWRDDEASRIGRQRHLLQLQYTDRLVGRVLDRLRDSGHYDETLVVLTADHGVAFGDGMSLRAVERDNLDQLAWVPLFIKEPGQTASAIDERPAETIDILPTVADHLAVDLPWRPDGRSLLGRPRRDGFRRLRPADDSLIDPERDGFVTLDGPRGYQATLDAAPSVPTEGPLRVFRTGTYGALVGQPLAPLVDGEAVEDGARLEPEVADVERGERDLPAEVTIRFGGDQPVPLAVAVDDTVAGWTRVHPDLETDAWLVLPEDLLPPGRHRLSLYRIERRAVAPRLRPVPLE